MLSGEDPGPGTLSQMVNITKLHTSNLLLPHTVFSWAKATTLNVKLFNYFLHLHHLQSFSS